MRTYIIVPFADVTEEIMDLVVESNINSLRHSVQGEDRVVLKYEGETPALLASYTAYTHEEILVEMATDTWTSNEGV
jgi:hypothetical protein